MAKLSSWFSLRRKAPPLSPSILVDKGKMPSKSSVKGPSSSPEGSSPDLRANCTDKRPSYLDIAGQCLERVQQLPPPKFSNEQCGYLVGKLKVTLDGAILYLGPDLEAQSDVVRRTSEDMPRCTEVFKLLFALALQIESFVRGCCKDEWLQAAMTLMRTGKYVSSLGFNLELCRVYFNTGWRAATKALTATEVDSIDREELEIVKRKAWQDEHVLLYKVLLELPSLRGEDKDLAIYLLQRLKRLKLVPTSLLPESLSGSDFNKLGFQRRIFQLVRQSVMLGKGASAAVHKAMWFGNSVAQKTIYGPENSDFIRETQILGGLSHPNVISMFCCGIDRRKCSIVMALMDEDLRSFMQRRLDDSPPFSVLEAVDVILQIGEGVNYLHENGIVHRDLKCSNMLVKYIQPAIPEFQYVLIKVTDFGISKTMESSTRYSNQTLNIGTARWMPPEIIGLRDSDGEMSAPVLQDGPRYPKKSDVYSFGMVCYEILTGDVPFSQESSAMIIRKKVLSGERPSLPDYCPSILKGLIEACWDPDPIKRPSFSSICLSLKHLKLLSMSDLRVSCTEKLPSYLDSYFDKAAQCLERVQEMPSPKLNNEQGEYPVDLRVNCTDKPPSYLDIAGQCLERVQQLPSPKFNNEQCGYLVGKLKVTLDGAILHLGPDLEAQSDVKRRTSEDMTRCTEVFQLLFAVALQIESFVRGCCKVEWLQAAMTLANTAEYVSSLGFNLELCRVYFNTGWGAATKALAATEVDSIDREELEIVKSKAWQDEHVFLNKVMSELPFLRGEAKNLAIVILQRLKRVKPASPALLLESPFWSSFDDRCFQDEIFQLVRQSVMLGKGYSATVHKAMWLGTSFAIKTFDGPEHPDFIRETQVLGGLSHPNVISMFCSAMDKRKCSILMELMDEDLHYFMQRRLDANPDSPPFSVLEAVDVILQIGEGVNYLHENGVVHRDLKSFNILVKSVLPTYSEFQYVLIKVADFGFAKIKESSAGCSDPGFNIGTARWMPPEIIGLRDSDGEMSAPVLQDGPRYPKKSDVYSFGMVCYEILTGDVPFPQESSAMIIRKKVLSGERPSLPDYCPSILKGLIEACWDPDPIKRPSFSSICLSLKHLKLLSMSGMN